MKQRIFGKWSVQLGYEIEQTLQTHMQAFEHKTKYVTSSKDPCKFSDSIGITCGCI